jgi:hypothetical protein
MKPSTAVFGILMMIAGTAMAYQVTGPVLEVTDSKIVVQKGNEKWEIARDKDTKVKGNLKKGSRVTVQYNMTATEIEVRDGAKKDAKGESSKKEKESKKDGK